MKINNRNILFMSDYNIHSKGLQYLTNINNCPLCGSYNLIVDYSKSNPAFYCVSCLDCEYIGPVSNNINNAIDNHNIFKRK